MPVFVSRNFDVKALIGLQVMLVRTRPRRDSTERRSDALGRALLRSSSSHKKNCNQHLAEDLYWQRICTSQGVNAILEVLNAEK